jgi:hypothetical protein
VQEKTETFTELNYILMDEVDYVKPTSVINSSQMEHKTIQASVHSASTEFQPAKFQANLNQVRSIQQYA